MSRKDYVAFAAALARRKPYQPDGRSGSRNAWRYEGMLNQWENDCTAVAIVFAADNPRFDSARFYRACNERNAR